VEQTFQPLRSQVRSEKEKETASLIERAQLAVLNSQLLLSQTRKLLDEPTKRIHQLRTVAMVDRTDMK